MKQLFSSDLSAAMQESEDRIYKELGETAKALGVEAKLQVMACPTVVSGKVEGERFFIRERHDSYRVEISKDRNEDPWTTDTETVTIAEGTVYELSEDGNVSPGNLLAHAVKMVTLHKLRTSCDHSCSPEGARFCCGCGVEL